MSLSTPSATSRFSSLPAEQLQNAFIKLEIEHFQKLAADSHNRLTGYETDSSLLNEGIWYGSNYYHALKTLDQKPRLDFLLKNDSFYDGYVPSGIFDRPKDSKSPTGHEQMTFDIKALVKPTTALEKLEKGPSLLDCAICCDLVAIHAFKEVIGEEKYNYLCAEGSPFALRISSEVQNVVQRLFNWSEIEEESSIEIGDFTYFENIPLYSIKNRGGHAGGINVLCSFKEDLVRKYLGLGLTPSGMTASEIKIWLYEHINSLPSDKEIFSPKVWSYVHSMGGDAETSRQLTEAYKNFTVTWEQFQNTEAKSPKEGIKVKDKLVLLAGRSDADRIKKMVDASLKDVREVFASFS